MKRYRIPVAFIFFKRLETTKQVFETIKKQKPSELYLIADGPRNDAESDKVSVTREYVESQIDWDCNIHRNYAERNMGCKKRIISGLDWVFQNTDMAVILEDDVKPLDSFFAYAEELLEKYKEEDNIKMIGGYNFLGDTDIEDSYWFYNRTSIWGWATWRRAWQQLDRELESWPGVKKSKYIEKNFSRNVAIRLRRDTDRAYYKEVDTWDFTWEYSVVRKGGLCILPRTNLIENIGGNSEDATHTNGDVKNYKLNELDFPLSHPSKIALNSELTKIIDANDESPNFIREYIKSRLPRKLVNRFRDVQ